MGNINQSLIMTISVILMVIGVLYQVAIGVAYQKMIQATDTMMGTDNKLLKYKMPRIEYRVDNKPTQTAAQHLLKEFFAGLEYCKSQTELISTIADYITGAFNNIVEQKPNSTKDSVVENVKYCFQYYDHPCSDNIYMMILTEILYLLRYFHILFRYLQCIHYISDMLEYQSEIF